MEERNDEFYMRRAIELALQAQEIDEVPVGAVAVRNGEIIAEAYNTRETTKCATHHAEVLCIERACATLGGWRLPGVTLYVTMEPCAMCAGAIINSRIKRVVYGAKDLKAGCCESVVDLFALPFNHKPIVEGGLLEEKSKKLLSDFFKELRAKKLRN